MIIQEAMYADKVNPTANGIFSNKSVVCAYLTALHPSLSRAQNCRPSCVTGTGLADGGGWCAPNPYLAKMTTGTYTDTVREIVELACFLTVSMIR